MRRKLSYLSLAALLLVCGVAQAADSPKAEARERFARGLDLFNQGDSGGALAEFQEAYELAPHPLVLFNLGLVYAALKQPVEAVDTFDRLLSAPGELSTERLARAQQERAAQAARIGVLEVHCAAEQASVEVDGLPRGNFKGSIKLRVASGAHLIAVSARGHLPGRQEASVAGGASERVDFKLEPTDVRPALLRIKTQLPEVEVWVDNQKVGETPLLVPVALSPGKHQVELRRAGYTSVTKQVDVASAATGELAAEPAINHSELARLSGQLALQISETSAVVFVDGASFGGKLNIQLPPGKHDLRIERAGFHDYQRQFEIRTGRTTDVQAPLDPTPAYRADFESSASTQRTLGWSGVAGGALIAGGSIGFLVWNKGQISDAETKFDGIADSFEDGGRCDDFSSEKAACLESLDLALEDLDTKRGHTKFGWIGLGVGVAAASVGVYLLLSGDDPGRYEPKLDQDPYAKLRLVPIAWVDEHSQGLGLLGSF